MRMMGTMAALVSVLSSGCYMNVGDGEPAADAGQFCIDQSFWECRRDQFAGRITTEEFDLCISSALSRCDDIAWPAGCRPTEDQAADCITLLQRGDLASITTAELYATYTECNLCGGP
jgi:hypothetical protein